MSSTETVELSSGPNSTAGRWALRNEKAQRPCIYPFSMIQRARRLRGWGWSYREISEELEAEFGTKVPLFTCRDWVMYWTRVSG